LLLDERPSRRAWLGLLIAFSGGVLIAFGDSCTLHNGLNCPPFSQIFGGTALTGDGLALIGGLAGAAYLILGREVRSGLNLVPYISIVYGAAAIILTLWALISGVQLLGYQWAIYGGFLLLALFPQLLAHTTYNWALKYLPATSVSLSLLGEPISAAILAWLILDESIPALRIIGGLIVLTGIMMAVYRPRKNSTQVRVRE
jgi:drug/metabolite transporter (DMT)-like permease